MRHTPQNASVSPKKLVCQRTINDIDIVLYQGDRFYMTVGDASTSFLVSEIMTGLDNERREAIAMFDVFVEVAERNDLCFHRFRKMHRDILSEVKEEEIEDFSMTVELTESQY